ncbi:MAG: AI-2E family transporter, partial [Chloroflexota bacterium]
FQQELIPRLPPPSKFLEAVTGDQGQLVLPILFDFSQSIGNVVNAIFVILFLSFYWSLNQINFERLWLSLLPPNQRKQARRIWQTIEIDLGAYIRSEIIQSILAGLLLGTGYWLLGSPYSALLAITGALVWVIPVVGAPLAVILPLFLGLLTSLQLGLFTAIYTLVVLVVVQVWVEPRFFRRKWDNPILTLIILLAMADAFGVLGVIVAPPISAIFQILWNLLGNKRNITGAAAQVSDLKERHAHVLDAVKAMDGPPLPLITSSIERLARLIKKAEPVLQEVLPVISSE